MCLVLAVIISLAVAATALAGGGSIRVGAPHTFCGVKSHNCSESYTLHGNDEFEAKITGNAPKGADVVTGFDGPITCKAKYKAEHHAYPLRQQLQGGASVSRGRFTVIYESAAYAVGTNRMCVYLIHDSTGKTFARASRKYTVLPVPPI